MKGEWASKSSTGKTQAHKTTQLRTCATLSGTPTSISYEGATLRKCDDVWMSGSSSWLR